MSAIRFVTCPPPPGIARAIRELWILDDDGAPAAGLPKPYVELVVSLRGIHWWRSAPAAPEHRFVEGWVTPVQRGPRYARAVGRRHLIGARLEPWAAMALFGPLNAGIGAPPPLLKTLIGGEARRLRARLIAADGDAARFMLLGCWLGSQPILHESGPLAREAHANVAALASALRQSPRSLRRRFARDAGVSPKTWLTLHRIDRVLRDPGLGDARRTLADLAYAHGYADQSHLSREIARWTGSKPSELRLRPGEVPPHFLPSS